MPIQDRSFDQNRKEKHPEEKAIVGAVNKYFKTAPSRKKPPTSDTEASIVNALRRYFGAE